MLRALRLVILTALLAVSLIAPASAVVPGEISYQGLLLDSGGMPVTGPVDLDFALFDVASGGTALWTESHDAVDVLDGVYDVTLGSSTPITPALIGGGALWLEVTVDTETLAPRQRLLAVPYAVRADVAESAENVGGVSNVFITELFQHLDADGGAPANDDPSEGLGDTDGDGIANFIDPDNDNDGISDAAEVARGSDINLVTPEIDSITPSTVDAALTTRVSVTGSNFQAGMTATFGTETPTLLNLTPTSFDADVGPSPVASGASVTLANGESDSASFELVSTVPSISGIAPGEVLDTATTRVTVTGENFVSGMTVTVGGVSTPVLSFSTTSFQLDVGPQTAGTVDVIVTLPDTQTASAPLTFSALRIATAFVTSAQYLGNLGGIAGADAKCQAAATAGSLSGTYLAWLSDGVTDPASRFSGVLQWRRTDGTTIADDWNDLVDGSIDAAITYDEFGNVLAGAANVASNVDASGFSKAGDLHCSGWTTSFSGSGRIGLASPAALNGAWTDLSSLSCGASVRLYCFEQ